MTVNTPVSRQPARTFREWLISGLSMVILGIWLGYFCYNDYRQTEVREQQHLSTQAKIIDDLITLQFEAVGKTLATLNRDPAVLRHDRRDAVPALNKQLETLVEAMISLRTIALFDASGRVVASSRDAIIGKSFPQREYFQAALKNPAPETIYVSPPFQTSLRAWTLTLSRAIFDEQGRLAGLVVAALDPEAIRGILASVRYAPDVWSFLVHEDGMLFMDEPEKPMHTGKNLAVPGSFFSRLRDSGTDAAVFRGKVYATGEESLIGMRTIQSAKLRMDKSLTVAIARDPRQVFAKWERDVLIYSILYALLAMVGAVSLFIAQRRQGMVESAEIQLSESRAVLEDFFVLSPDPLCIADAAWRFRKLNPAWEKVFGYPLVEIEGKPFDAYLHPEDVDTATTAMSGLSGETQGISFISRFRLRDGAYRYFEWQAVLRGELIFASARDVTERRQNELRLEFMAYHDRLTGLANRSLLFGRLSHSLASAGRNNKKVAILFVDLDGFKDINDQYGHEGGDIVLRTVARRFLVSVREADTVARIGGDEFVIVLTDLNGPSEAEAVAKNLLHSVQQEISLLGGIECRVGASIGISMYPADSREMDELLEAADEAMYRSKKEGKNRYCFATISPRAETGEHDEISLDEDHLVGIGDIDRQHRQMTELVNRLNHSLKNNADEVTITGHLRELTEYTTLHFDMERELMERFDYPDRAAHNAAHQYLLAEIAGFREQIFRKGNLFLITLTRNWLLRHIAKEDMLLGKFLAAKMPENTD